MEEHVFLSGADCYALRCAFLHEGRDEITDQRAGEVLDAFAFVVPPAGSAIHSNQNNQTLQLQVDIFLPRCAEWRCVITCRRRTRRLDAGKTEPVSTGAKLE